MARLKRELGLSGAVMMGLGAMVGTGVFVSIGIAAGVAGPAAIMATALAAGVALCNALSSAQLAAAQPVSGGTYEYGYIYLNPWLGFTAGWVFLIAKSASAATAALGFGGYLLTLLDVDAAARIPIALTAVAIFTLIVLGGIRQSNVVNIVVVTITVLALLFFVAMGEPSIEPRHYKPWFGNIEGAGARAQALFHATALMFVAYTGYARIATLGEEVHEPERTIPRAIVLTMSLTLILYVSVITVAIGVIGASGLQEATAADAAPLAAAAQSFNVPFASTVLAVGAITAMLGVLLNLILGLSRVALAMGRRGDMPSSLSRVSKRSRTPYVAVIVVGVTIATLALIGDVKTTWSFSAFTVLIYYALTNWAALKLPARQRRYPRWIAVVGLTACLFLAFWVEPQTWLIGLALIAVGLVWHAVARWQRDKA
jgi:APA family basic amino acid/polyamine antiporter